jgi:hypothetical protein
MFVKQFVTALFLFFVIVLLTKAQTGKVIPLKVHKCDLKVEKVVNDAVDYINKLPCVFAVFKKTSGATNFVMCTEKFDKKFMGLYVPQLTNFKILLRLNETSNFNLTHNVILHELGHALGLSHNKNKNSVMYSVVSSKQLNGFDLLDIVSLELLHSLRKGSTCSVSRHKQEKFGLPIVP